MNRERTTNYIGAFIMAVAIALIPVMAFGKKVVTGLEGESWFADTSATYDFFLVYKGIALESVCALLAVYIFFKVLIFNEGFLNKPEKKYVFALGLYLAFAILSTVFADAKERNMAILGGYEQWEGIIILLAYVVLCFMAMVLIGDVKSISMGMWGLVAACFLVSIIGAGQALGLDFFKTDIGKGMLNFFLDQKLDFSFNFEANRSYATLYNPNYIGPFVALLLPVTLLNLEIKKWIKDIILLITSVLAVVMLIGSGSAVGYMAVAVEMLICVVFAAMFYKRRVVIPVVVLVLAVGAAGYFSGALSYVGNKLANPVANNFTIKEMYVEGDALHITTKDDKSCSLRFDVGETELKITSDDPAVKATKDGDYYVLNLEGFEDVKFKNVSDEYTVGYDKAMEISTPSTGHTYKFVFPEDEAESADDKLLYYNVYDKADKLEKIPTFGFEDRQHFGSRRGYIWSRTMPLLKTHLLLGSGPNTFVYDFPNNDYVGLENVNYTGSVVTKPHNLYLQIFTQTGLPSLVGFLLLVIFYIVDTFRIAKRFTEEIAENAPSCVRIMKLGISICIGIMGYLFTGLANDSTVAVAPVFWFMIGLGVAVNAWLKRKLNRNRNHLQ